MAQPWQGPEWVETPPWNSKKNRTYIEWGPRVASLDAKPGEWAIIARDIYAGAQTYLSRRYPGYEFMERGMYDDANRAEALYGRKVVGPPEIRMKVDSAAVTAAQADVKTWVANQQNRSE